MRLPDHVPVRLVLADDEPLLRRGLRVLLEADGRVEVVGEAADGSGLLDAVRRHRPDVALVDVQMPGMDGLSALRALLAWTSPPAVAVLTTFDLDDYVTTA
ncbi:MAG: response regulator transcription factor, partial [Saccharothrix sp.]|nr:response regulator transcription factor [Saccharothrix sp.]